MKKEFMSIVKAFADNGVYTLNNKTECVEFSVLNSKMLDISDISEDMVFNSNVDTLKAPKITTHDRTMLLLIAKYGVLNFQDLRQAVKIRSELEAQTCGYVFTSNADLKNIIDEKLTNKGLVVRCRIYQEYIKEGEVVRRHEYIYCVTAKGINVVNSCMGCKFKDSNSFRLLNDINTRDKISRMATAHIALYLAQYGFNALEKHYSSVTKNNVERYILLMYNESINTEVMLQPLYLLRNAKLETEVEFSEKVKTLVDNVFRWVTWGSEFEVKGEQAKRKVVLICNSLMEYNQFVNVLIDYFSLKDYFGHIGSVYATSVGMIDSATTVEEAFYRHVDIQMEEGKLVPVGGELSSFFGDGDRVVE